MEKKELIDFKLNAMTKAIKMSRKAKFIKRTLHNALEGRRLNRKNLLTLQIFFENAIKDFETMRLIITHSLLDDIGCPEKKG